MGKEGGERRGDEEGRKERKTDRQTPPHTFYDEIRSFSNETLLATWEGGCIIPVQTLAMSLGDTQGSRDWKEF